MEIEFIIVLTRATILIISALAGVLCIYLGWRLFFETAKAKSSLEIGHANFKLSLSSTAPGLFFTLFGIILLIVSIQSKIEVSNIESTVPSVPVKPAKYYSNHIQSPVTGFIRVSESKPTATVIAASATSAQANTSICKYKSRTIKWFDAPDSRPEQLVILDALGDAAKLMQEKINIDPQGTVTLQRSYVVLLHTIDGFK